VCPETARRGLFSFILHGIFVPVNIPELFRHAQGRQPIQKDKKIMKTKMMLMTTLVVILGGGMMLFSPRHLSAQTNGANAASPKILYYTCEMHPSVRSDKPGKCPECGMMLEPVYETAKDTNAPPAAAGTNAPSAMMSGCCTPGVGR
jgi:hypothetical protein